MTNKDFTVASNKLFYYAMNYPSNYVTYDTLWEGSKTEVLPDFLKALKPSLMEHYVKKWKYAREKYGTHGAFFGFYAELDGINRINVLKYINEKYSMSDTYGLDRGLYSVLE